MGVAEAQIHALVPGQTIKVTIADMDGVKADRRGKVYEVVFDRLGSYSDDGGRTGKLVLARAGGQAYGFHDWLIEKIEVVA